MNYLFVLFLVQNAFGQVGINTPNPQGIFNVDGAKDNPATGSPSATQQANDFVITASGNAGIGTTSPVTKLEINNGTTAGAIKIQDGTQAAGKVLTSDANGLATWMSPVSFQFNNINQITMPAWGVTAGPTTRLTIINGPVVNNVSNDTWVRGFIQISKDGTSWITISEAISRYPSTGGFYIPSVLTGMIPAGWYYRITRQTTALDWNTGHIYELY